MQEANIQTRKTLFLGKNELILMELDSHTQVNTFEKLVKNFFEKLFRDISYCFYEKITSRLTF